MYVVLALFNVHIQFCSVTNSFFFIRLTYHFDIEVSTVFTVTATDHKLFASACDLLVDKFFSKGEMIKNSWRYKCDEEKISDVSMINKMAAQYCSEISKKQLEIDRLFLSLARKLLKKG